MDVKIKKAVLAQVKDLQEFMFLLMKYEHNFDKTTDVKWAKSKDCENYFKKQIKGRDSVALIALFDGKIVGYLSGEVKKADLWRNIKKQGKLADMFVSEKFRNKKIGSLLVGEFLKWAKKKGAERVEVQAYAKNEKAHKFYKRHGFDDCSIILERGL